MIGVCPSQQASLGNNLWSIAAGPRVRLAMNLYWRGITVAIEVITALNTLGLVGALPPLLNVVAQSIWGAAHRRFRPLWTASPH